MLVIIWEIKKTEGFYVMCSTDAACSTRGTAALDLCPSSPPGDSFTEAASALFQSNLLTALINAALGTFFFFFFSGCVKHLH